MQNRFEGFTTDMGTPVTRVLTRSMGTSVVNGMASSRAAQKAKNDQMKQQAYRKGILDVLYAHQVQGIPLPGMEKLMGSLPQGNPGLAPGTPPAPPLGPPMGGAPPMIPGNPTAPPMPPPPPAGWQPPNRFLDPHLTMGGPGASQGMQ